MFGFGLTFLAIVASTAAATLLSGQVGGLRVTREPAGVRVGSPPRSEIEEFGLIVAATLLPDGATIVSDRAKKRLVYLSSDGRNVFGVGRVGSGPGEMREPSSLSVLPSGELVLLDRALARLSFFTPTSTGLRYSRDLTLERIPDDFCAVRGGYLSLRYDPRSRTILHRLSPVGQEITAFGSPLFEASERVNVVATQGLLLCLPDRAVVVLAPSLRGEVRAYSLTGQLQWQTQLAGYLPPEVREVRGGGVLFGWYPPGQGKSHIGMGLTRLGPEHLLVQFGLRTRQHRGSGFEEDFEEIDSRILRLSDGREVGRQTDLPIVLHASRSRLVTTGNEPEPWIEVSAYQLSEVRQVRARPQARRPPG